MCSSDQIRTGSSKDTRFVGRESSLATRRGFEESRRGGIRLARAWRIDGCERVYAVVMSCFEDLRDR